MVNPPPTPGASRQPLPDGAPSHVRFDGLLQGRLADRGRLDRAVEQLGRLGLGRLSVEVDLGRFTALPPDEALDGAPFDHAGRGALDDALRELVQAAERGSVESSLRATFVWADGQAVDVLFAVRDGALTPVGAVRNARATDAAPARGSLTQFVPRRILALLGVAAVVTLAMLLWQTPFVQAWFAPSLADLPVRVAPADGDYLRAAVVDEGERPLLVILPGDALPRSIAEFDQAWQSASDLAARRSLLRVLDADGRVQILDDLGRTLASQSFDADALLRGESVELTMGVLPSRAESLWVTLSR